MRRAADWKWIGLTLLLLGTECSSQGLPPRDAGGSTESGGIGGTGGLIFENIGGRIGSGGTGTGGNGAGGYICDGVGVIPGNCFGGMTGSGGKGTGGLIFETIGGMTGSAGKDGGTGSDAVVCCPPDAQPSGCTHLGGAAVNGMCDYACDFFNSSHWRIETDAYGCPVWRYDFTGGCSPDAAAPKMCFDGGP
jgi:hypothetical protein